MNAGLVRTDAVEVLARHRGDMLSLVTMQAIAPWNALGQADSRNFNVVACMGSAASIGLGLALARPHDRILVIDGDGSLLMQLGSLVSIAEHRPLNIYHVVMRNGTYETSGGQSVPGRDIASLCGIALASGYMHAFSFGELSTLDDGLPQILRLEGPVLISLEITSPGHILPAPNLSQAPNKPTQVDNMRRALSSP